MKKRSLVLAALAAVGAAVAVGPAGAQTADATVVVVHGIPDRPVDVYVNAELTLDDFTFGTVTDPLSLPAGSYELDIRAADASASDAPLLSATADVPGGA